MIANLADAQIEIERLGEEIQNLREENERLQTLVNKRAKVCVVVKKLHHLLKQTTSIEPLDPILLRPGGSNMADYEKLYEQVSKQRLRFAQKISKLKTELEEANKEIERLNNLLDEGINILVDKDIRAQLERKEKE